MNAKFQDESFRRNPGPNTQQTLGFSTKNFGSSGRELDKVGSEVVASCSASALLSWPTSMVTQVSTI